VLYLSTVSGRPTPQGLRIAAKLRQADLANLLGATPRSIITILNEWRAKGIVTYDGARASLTMCRPDELQRLVGTGP
jgi:CRP/FNR family transcriptional regulator, cyclic AMP receptor protein